MNAEQLNIWKSAAQKSDGLVRIYAEDLLELIALAERTTSHVMDLTEKDWLNIKLAAIHLKEAKFHTASDNLMDIFARRRSAPAAAPAAPAPYPTRECAAEALTPSVGAPAEPVAEQSVDDIVTALYRRFKDWSKRGFGPDDVTWCEVKADVMALIAASQQATEPVACTCNQGQCCPVCDPDVSITAGQRPQDERAAFEATYPGAALMRDGDGYGKGLMWTHRWDAWQARAALAKKGGT